MPERAYGALGARRLRASQCGAMLPADLAGRLAAEAERRGISVSALLAEYAEAGLRAQAPDSDHARRPSRTQLPPGYQPRDRRGRGKRGTLGGWPPTSGPASGSRVWSRGWDSAHSCTPWPPGWAWPDRVGNDVDGVFAEVEGPAEHVRDFLAALERDARRRWPASSGSAPSPWRRTGGPASRSWRATGGRRRALVSADSATCADSSGAGRPGRPGSATRSSICTNCGPRFTIVRDVPYDRPLTTMAGFTMCAACAAEYHDPASRFHAQPVCCLACGPRLRLLGADGTERSGPDGALGGAVAALDAGQVLAVKGLGGYHLAVDAASEKAASLLRARKHREDKPFAVMAPDLAAARALCEVDTAAAAC